MSSSWCVPWRNQQIGSKRRNILQSNRERCLTISKQGQKMKCPKLVINLFAKNLRMKAVEIEEYIDENESSLDPMQVQRLRRMNKSMKARCCRMKQAWLEHDPTVDKVDADCLVKLGDIVNNREAEVAETLQTSYAVLQERDTATDPKRSRWPRGSVFALACIGFYL